MSVWRVIRREEMEILEYETPEWQASVALSSGGNLIRLRYLPKEVEILRFPRNGAELKARPECYGSPLLLPPNRIADGMFQANHVLYRLPVNERETHSHLHGLVLGRKWTLLSAGEEGIAVGYRFSPRVPEYSGFPHEFQLELRYCFAPEVVTTILSIRNSGRNAMPLGVGVHTTFLLPPEEEPSVAVPRGEGFWEVHPRRRLPTGRLLPWDPGIADLLDGKRSSASLPVAHLFPLRGKREALIRRSRCHIRYRFDEKYAHLACWNQGGTGDFFCIEPMSWMTNAPNLPLPPEISGFSFLEGGKTRIFRSAFRIEI